MTSSTSSSAGCRSRSRPVAAAGSTLEPLRATTRSVERIELAAAAARLHTAADWKNAQVRWTATSAPTSWSRACCCACCEIQDANLPGTLADTDIEFLHDFRVAIRRTRSVLREMRGRVRADDLERVRASFKWLQDQTSATRDLDVYLHEFDELRAMAPDIGAGRPRAARAAAERAASARSRGDGAGAQQRAGTDSARGVAGDPGGCSCSRIEAERPDAARPIGELAAGGSARCTARW